MDYGPVQQLYFVTKSVLFTSNNKPTLVLPCNNDIKQHGLTVT